MGRGRAKAKQTKVARELKYRAFDTDYGALERELRGSEGHEVPPAYVDDDDDQRPDAWGDLRKSG